MDSWRVMRIDEQMYGCEELPEGQPVCCDVLLEDSEGRCRVVAVPDRELVTAGIDEGCAVRVDENGSLKLL